MWCEGEYHSASLEPGETMSPGIERIDSRDQRLLAREWVELNNQRSWGSIDLPWPVQEIPADRPHVSPLPLFAQAGRQARQDVNSNRHKNRLVRGRSADGGKPPVKDFDISVK